ncbi:MAG: rhomboid family intramembrane serine protease [Rikenellaceae bacterium]|nr:rhomboid family intramembrane serine protease [Rikenellaceae bacterium]
MINLLIIITAGVSILCFRDRRIFDRLALKPYIIVRSNQWDRMITHGFVHADWIHLLVNMLVFWSFGRFVIHIFEIQYAQGISVAARPRFLLLYFGGLIAASVYDVVTHRNNPYYTSIGASGAVSAVVFTSVFLSPMSRIYLMGAIPMPAIVFALLYIGYETYSARRGGGKINHHAHIFGAVYGFIFPMLTGGISQLNIFLDGFR